MRAQGTGIEITLWREFAEKFYDHLQVDQVRGIRAASAGQQVHAACHQ